MTEEDDDSDDEASDASDNGEGVDQQDDDEVSDAPDDDEDGDQDNGDEANDAFNDGDGGDQENDDRFKERRASNESNSSSKAPHIQVRSKTWQSPGGHQKRVTHSPLFRSLWIRTKENVNRNSKKASLNT